MKKPVGGSIARRGTVRRSYVRMEAVSEVVQSVEMVQSRLHSKSRRHCHLRTKLTSEINLHYHFAIGAFQSEITKK